MKVNVQDALKCMNLLNEMTEKAIKRLKAIPEKEFVVTTGPSPRDFPDEDGYLSMGSCHPLPRGPIKIDEQLPKNLAGAFVLLSRAFRLWK